MVLFLIDAIGVCIVISSIVHGHVRRGIRKISTFFSSEGASLRIDDGAAFEGVGTDVGRIERLLRVVQVCGRIEVMLIGVPIILIRSSGQPSRKWLKIGLVIQTGRNFHFGSTLLSNLATNRLALLQLMKVRLLWTIAAV